MRPGVLGDAGVSAYGAAIIAGAAAIVGGLLTAGSNLFAESLRRRQAQRAQAERDQRELRQATRLVLSELLEIRHTIQRAARTHVTWENSRPLPGFAWREYRAILAAHLPISAWRWVLWAYQDANALNWHVADVNRKSETEGPVHFDDKEWLRDSFRTTYRAMAELEDALGEPRGAFGYTGYADVEDLEEGVWNARSEQPADEEEPTE